MIEQLIGLLRQQRASKAAKRASEAAERVTEATEGLSIKQDATTKRIQMYVNVGVKMSGNQQAQWRQSQRFMKFASRNLKLCKDM